MRIPLRLAATAAALLAAVASTGPRASASTTVEPPPDSFQEVSPLLPGRIGSMVASDPSTGHVYSAGGYVTSGPENGYTARTQGYDVDSNSWFDLPPLPGARSFGVAAVLDGELWVLGGVSDVDPDAPFETQILDLQNRAWRSGPTLPVEVSQAVAGVVGDQIVVVNRDGVVVTVDEVGATVDPVAGIDPVYAAVGVSTGGALVLTGGYSGGDAGGLQVHGETWAITPGAPATLLSPLPVPRANAQMARGGDGRLYVFGGNDLSSNRVDSHALDPATGRWIRVADLPTPLTGGGAAPVRDGRILVLSNDRAFLYTPAATTTDNQTVSAAVEAGTLSIAVDRSTVDLGTIRGGEASAAVAVGTISYRNTLRNGSPWSATVVASPLRFGGPDGDIGYEHLVFAPGDSPEPPGQISTGVESHFSGSGALSDPLTLISAPSTAIGDFVQPGSTLLLEAPADARSGTYTGLLQYTIVG